MSNRSGTTYSAPTDANRRPVLLGASTADGVTPVSLEADPITGALVVVPNSPTGSTFPSNVYAMGASDGTRLVAVQVRMPNSDTVGTTASALMTEGFNYGYNGTSWERSRVANSASNSTGTGLMGAGVLGFDGTNYQTLRTPTVFKTVQATASGNTALWTPTTGKKFRIQGYDVQVTANATKSVAGVISITLNDGASTSTGMVHDIYVPSAAGQANFAFDSGWHRLGNGYLSIAADNVLNVNLSSALTAGNIRIIVMGNEE